ILDSEFQSLLVEIDRQAQTIGLDQGGAFAKNFSVFIGGGRANAGVTSISNGSGSVDLSQSTVDSNSLGMAGVQATGVAGTDIGSGSATTSVQQIVGNANNVTDLRTAGFSEFKFVGPGFADSEGVTVSVNISGVTDTSTLVEAVNAGIESAGNGSTQAATAFKNAGVKASVVTDSAGRQQLAFISSTSAFQVKANDLMSNALMGNFNGAGPEGATMSTTVTGDVATQAGATTFAGTTDLVFRVQGAGMSSPVDLTVSVTAATTVTAAIASLSAAVINDSTLSAAGITLTGAAAAAQLEFTSTRGEAFDVQVTGDTANLLGMGSFNHASGSDFDYQSIVGTWADGATGNANFEFSINGGASATNIVTFAHTNGTSTADDLVNYMNQQFNLDAQMKSAGLTANNAAGTITISSDNGTYFRLNAYSGTTDLGFGEVGATFTANASSAAPATSAQVNSGGADASTAFAYGNLAYGTDDQTISISANDAAGVNQAETVVIKNDGAADRYGRNIDQVIDKINAELQQTNNSTLQQIVAVKVNAAGTEQIQFLSSLDEFKVTVGATTSTNGVGSQGTTDTSAALAGGSTSAIDTQAGGEAAVSALAAAVATLGASQAVVGKGQNRFNFAVSLAQTQLNNLAASESRIRDADLAAEAANLTKAQILQQAGIAALAQANVAPQAVLSLLSG
ncbi:MAG: hypothetical protein GY778_17985, partial [bacterium]|nr:hypothetical protein [bacterium]